VNLPLSVPEGGGLLPMCYRVMGPDPADKSGVLCVATREDGGQAWGWPALGPAKQGGTRETGTEARAPGRHITAVPSLHAHPGVPEDQRARPTHRGRLSGEAYTADRDPVGRGSDRSPDTLTCSTRPAVRREAVGAAPALPRPGPAGPVR